MRTAKAGSSAGSPGTVRGVSRRRSRRRCLVLALLLGCTALSYRAAWAQALPSITINDVTVAEGDSGTTNATFVVSMSAASSQPVTVHYATANGSAVAAADYQATSGTLTFSPGETSKTITVKVKGDTIPEGDEVFYLQLSLPSNATIADPQGTATIADDDETVSISDSHIGEPDPGTTDDALFEVTLSAPSQRTVTVHFSTADGSAVAGEDYVPVNGTLTFRPGEAAKTITVKVRNDLVATPDEKFYVVLFNPSRVKISRARGEATIVDLDRAIAILDTTVLEPDPGSQRLAVFEVQLGSPSAGSTISSGIPGELPVSVDFATADGTAVAGLDYQPTSGTLVFPPGVASEQILVPVFNDNAALPDKRFTINLFNSVNAPLADSVGAAFIVENDRTLSIEDTSVTEGDVGGVVATFVVTLSSPSPLPVSVGYATEPGTALAGEDFVPESGVLTFAPGEISKRIDVPIVGDLVDEGETPETFSLALSAPQGVQLARARAIGSIVDDDLAISVFDPTVTEPDEGTVDATFTVSLSSARSRAVEVDYATVDGTATAPDDYLSRSGTLVFAPYEVSKTITVPVVGDLVEEPDETFSVRLTNPVGAKLRRDQVDATILASDQGYFLAASDGGVFAFGDARFRGSTGDMRLNQHMVAMAASPSGNGYWLAASDGGVFAFGDARFFGSTGGLRGGSPIVAMVATPSGNGYWLAGSDGHVSPFGDAGLFGSTGPLRPNAPIVAMAATPSGNGYWLAASDGGVFAFGDARFLGSTADVRLSQPIVGLAATPSGNGYWLVAADGGIFAFGDAGFWGSTGGMSLSRPVIGMTCSPSGNGYWLVAADGGIFAFGAAPFYGSTGAMRLNRPIVGMAPLTGRFPLDR